MWQAKLHYSLLFTLTGLIWIINFIVGHFVTHFTKFMTSRFSSATFTDRLFDKLLNAQNVSAYYRATA